ncbi:MAG TPA: hypothetical protein PK987_00785 [Ferruginibacter sp.]|nr:hypothetical protein [Ferruginibacter sp.]
MKKQLTTNWNFIRLIRLLVGFAILMQAILVSDVLFIILGILFTAMPVFNIGCCSTNGCYTPVQKKSTHENEISYEEVV